MRRGLTLRNSLHDGRFASNGVGYPSLGSWKIVCRRTQGGRRVSRLCDGSS